MGPWQPRVTRRTSAAWACLCPQVCCGPNHSASAAGFVDTAQFHRSAIAPTVDRRSGDAIRLAHIRLPVVAPTPTVEGLMDDLVQMASTIGPTQASNSALSSSSLAAASPVSADPLTGELQRPAAHASANELSSVQARRAVVNTPRQDRARKRTWDSILGDPAPAATR